MVRHSRPVLLALVNQRFVDGLSRGTTSRLSSRCPEQLFYNTGIATYIWLVTNRKSPDRVGKVQLIDARDIWAKMRKSLGDKRRYIRDEQIGEITALHGVFEEGERVKILPNDAFGYRVITVDQPLRATWRIGGAPLTREDFDRVAVKIGDAETREAVWQALGRMEPSEHR